MRRIIFLSLLSFFDWQGSGVSKAFAASLTVIANGNWDTFLQKWVETQEQGAKVQWESICQQSSSQKISGYPADDQVASLLSLNFHFPIEELQISCLSGSLAEIPLENNFRWQLLNLLPNEDTSKLNWPQIRTLLPLMEAACELNNSGTKISFREIAGRIYFSFPPHDPVKRGRRTYKVSLHEILMHQLDLLARYEYLSLGELGTQEQILNSLAAHRYSHLIESSRVDLPISDFLELLNYVDVHQGNLQAQEMLFEWMQDFSTKTLTSLEQLIAPLDDPTDADNYLQARVHQFAVKQVVSKFQTIVANYPEIQLIKLHPYHPLRVPWSELEQMMVTVVRIDQYYRRVFGDTVSALGEDFFQRHCQGNFLPEKTMAPGPGAFSRCNDQLWMQNVSALLRINLDQVGVAITHYVNFNNGADECSLQGQFTLQYLPPCWHVRAVKMKINSPQGSLLLDEQAWRVWLRNAFTQLLFN